ncbi:Holliday junction resolvase RuvX [Prochlorococcus marinus]|uniref:Holliday junction resolvase RuvX n=1 Tax=Prochlorococcus marinus TaxID=1219 RepID=UPI0022B44191|nr:Holliday junction resolvase RuvX [Prochlorococcus marinus]
MPGPQPQSVISLDIGKKRIGLAGCDPLGLTVTRLGAIHRSSFKQELTELKKLCIKRNVKGLVVGLPLDKSGVKTKQSTYCKKYGCKLAKELQLPLAWVNEHSSTWEAAQKYKLYNDRSGSLDSAAASILLSQWLQDGPELQFLNLKPLHS